jgi:hypothetical protein
MSRHRYINIDVGLDLPPSPDGGGKKGGTPKLAPYDEAKAAADALRELLSAQMRSNSVLRRYVLKEVLPTIAHGGKGPGEKQTQA